MRISEIKKFNPKVVYHKFKFLLVLFKVLQYLFSLILMDICDFKYLPGTIKNL